MGVLFDYFAAPSDDEARAVIDRPGGPGVASAPAPQRRSFFSRKPPTAPEPGPVYDTAHLKGVDPVVMITTLESILTGVSYEDLIARGDGVLEVRDGGQRLIVAVQPSLQSALAALPDDRVADVAGKWGATDEFHVGPPWSPEDVTRVAQELSSLAKRATAAACHLYCWVCV